MFNIFHTMSLDDMYTNLQDIFWHLVHWVKILNWQFFLTSYNSHQQKIAQYMIKSKKQNEQTSWLANWFPNMTITYGSL